MHCLQVKNRLTPTETFEKNNLMDGEKQGNPCFYERDCYDDERGSGRHRPPSTVTKLVAPALKR